ncbi:hypothetical protein CONPUDRAFT_156137 [Coniophora puteana RWD-64-598 SS2]|uniref:F-box domain-containing protein n=1 Tax=Coniophora puteana (strain RWD-64-598) TaxID=741705 RepID=A0A5M3MGE6_CONPW|nr:uncharacterized protein CONPUDRAFT_156137 [Coniophora puteana RWD-64-598 SS2]EIW78127.1 hypothetical protein CONPUDRAFT_156137 [Coniophora puteana RWD-64-598 SS2]
MHDCLLVIEIFRVICEQLASSSTEHHAALSAVARTCRVFKEPALDALWAELDKLEPLIRCLPEALWRWELPDSPDRCLVIRRPLRASDWDLFRYYSNRVRVLTHEHASDRIAPNTLALLGFPNRTAPLFPNLHRVCWTDNRSEAYPFLDVVCGSHLKELSMNLPEIDTYSDADSMIARSFLHSIVGRCATLKSLEIREEDVNPDYEDAISEVVSSLPKLEVLNCGLLEYGAIAHLDQLESLRELSFTVSPKYSYQDLHHPFLFGRLSYLGLASADSLGIILPLLQYIPRLPPFFIFSALRST